MATTTKMSIINEAPVKRESFFFGPFTIQLGLDDGQVDLARVSGGRVQFLLDHDDTQPVGMIRDAYVRQDGRNGKRMLFGDVEFMEEADAAAKFQKERAARQGVSAGVAYNAIELLDEEEWTSEDIPAMKATSWELVEVSSVTTPAFSDVGFDRTTFSIGADRFVLGDIHDVSENLTSLIAPHMQQFHQRQEAKMTTQAEQTPPAGVTIEREVVDPRVAFERDVLRSGAQFGIVDDAVQFIAANPDETDTAKWHDKAMSVKFGTPGGRVAPMLREQNPEEEFSLAKRIRAEYEPGLARQDTGAFEIAVTDEFARNASRGPQKGGFMLDQKLLRPKDAEFAVSTGNATPVLANPSSAAPAVETEVDLARAYQWLVDRSPVLQRFEMIPGLVDNLSFPVVTRGTDPGMEAEGDTRTAQDPTLAQRTMTPHEAQARFGLTRQIMVQTAGWIDGFLRQTMGLQFAEFITAQAFNGDGTGDAVKGLLNADATSHGRAITSDTVAIGAALANYLSAWDYAKIVGVWDGVASKKYAMTRPAFVANHGFYADWLTRAKNQAAVAAGFIIDGGTPPGGSIIGLPVDYVTDTIIPTKPTTGATARPQAVFGDFANAYLGMWLGMEVIVDPYSDKPNLDILGIQMFDVTFSWGDAFTLMTH